MKARNLGSLVVALALTFLVGVVVGMLRQKAGHDHVTSVPLVPNAGAAAPAPLNYQELEDRDRVAEAKAWNDRARQISDTQQAAWASLRGKPQWAQSLEEKLAEVLGQVTKSSLPPDARGRVRDLVFQAKFEVHAAAIAETAEEALRAGGAAPALREAAKVLSPMAPEIAEKLDPLAKEAEDMVKNI